MGSIMQSDDEAVLVAYGSNLSPDGMSASQVFTMVVKNLHERGLIVNKISRLWRSQAWPDATAPAYVNAVIQVRTSLNAVDLLAVLHYIERDFGRSREGARYAPRVVDLDLIAYGRQISGGEGGLTLPHPRAHERGFVMGPLSEIAPRWKHPLLHREARELYAAVTVGRDAHPLGDDATAVF